MVKVELFTNVPFNGSNKMSNFASLADQNAWFSGVPASDKKVLEDVKFTSLYAPILVEETIDALYPYTYGRIRLNTPSTDGGQNWYYFSIDHYETDRQDKTYIYYIIDYWETYRYAHTEGSSVKLTVGRARVNRCSLDIGCRIKHAYTAVSTTQVKDSVIERNVGDWPYKWCAIATYHVNSTNKDMVLLLISKNGIRDLLGFDWASASIIVNMQPQQINVNQIMGIWYSPFTVSNDGFNFCWSDTNQGSGYNIGLFCSELTVFNRHKQEDGYHEFTVTVPTQPSEQSKVGITDAMGNLVWVSDMETLGSSLKLSLNITMTTCRWFGYVQRNNAYTNGECMFTIPCEPMDIFSDAFIAYYTQQRPFTERQRAIQKDEATVNGLANIGTSILGGAVAGSIAAPGIGTVAGAVGGALASTVGTAITSMATETFNKMYQKNEDAQARMQTDDLRFEGAGLMDCAMGYTGPWFVLIVSDSDSWNGYQNDISAYGYFYDTEYTGIETLLTNNSTFKLTCNAEIENVPAIAERSVKARLQAGVEFIRPVRT